MRGNYSRKYRTWRTITWGRGACFLRCHVIFQGTVSFLEKFYKGSPIRILLKMMSILDTLVEASRLLGQAGFDVEGARYGADRKTDAALSRITSKAKVGPSFAGRLKS